MRSSFILDMNRLRIKQCYKCTLSKKVLYRCRFKDIKDWKFLCSECLKKIKIKYQDTYQYGGTWKSKKK